MSFDMKPICLTTFGNTKKIQACLIWDIGIILFD